MGQASKNKFRWAIDSKGYRLSKDGAKIIRDGGALKTYEPDSLNPAPHFLFANLRAQIIHIDENAEPNQEKPFWARRFPSESEAHLAFVQEFGFLSCADAKSEALATLEEHQRHISAFQDFAGAAPIENFNRWVGPRFSIRLDGNKRRGIGLQLIPESLIDWMWLRSGLDLVNGTKWRECRYCGRPIAIGKPTQVRSALIMGTGFLRKGAMFCSDSCKVMAARKRPNSKRKK